MPGRVKCEQPGFCEEGIGPAEMVRQSSAHAGAATLLSMQQRAQAPTDEPIEPAEGVRVRVLEVGEPAPQQWVEIGDDPRERLSRAFGVSSPGCCP